MTQNKKLETIAKLAIIRDNVIFELQTMDLSKVTKLDVKRGLYSLEFRVDLEVPESEKEKNKP